MPNGPTPFVLIDRGRICSRIHTKIQILPLRKYINSLRKFRVWHRFLGTSLAILLLISALTGVFLALKKDLSVIQPATTRGLSKDLNQWKPLKELDSLARLALYTAHPQQAGNEVHRIDVRPSKGIAKVLFKKGYWEVQIDGVDGSIKSIAKRHSDWIEALHDGSIISDSFKVVSMNVLGWGLMVLLASGLWLWYGPKRYRMLKKRRSKETTESESLSS